MNLSRGYIPNEVIDALRLLLEDDNLEKIIKILKDEQKKKTKHK